MTTTNKRAPRKVSAPIDPRADMRATLQGAPTLQAMADALNVDGKTFRNWVRGTIGVHVSREGGIAPFKSGTHVRKSDGATVSNIDALLDKYAPLPSA
jgi:hypothetical protein